MTASAIIRGRRAAKAATTGPSPAATGPESVSKGDHQRGADKHADKNSDLQRGRHYS